jgi:hypothetical protein
VLDDDERMYEQSTQAIFEDEKKLSRKECLR